MEARRFIAARQAGITMACAHCGLPLEAEPEGAGPHFCCTGCSLVYQALGAAGLGDTYYRLRGYSQGGAVPRPPEPRSDGLRLAELDSPAFLDQHTAPQPDGTRSAELHLDGVHCAACVWLVERLPFEQAGVLEARLDLPRARMSVRWNPDHIKLSTVASWLSRFGYTALPLNKDFGSDRHAQERALLLKMGICWALAGNVMLLAFALYSGLGEGTHAGLATGARWLSLFLAVPAVVYGAQGFMRRAWVSVRLGIKRRDPRHLHMDTPIALGILVGFGHSAWATVSGSGEIWFDSVTVLIAALLTARWLQLRSQRLARDATERLLNLVPPLVRRVDEGETIALVPAEEIGAGDVVEVPAGEVIPVDGVVLGGVSSVNNAVLTGESAPEPVHPGERVAAGATNEASPIRVRVEAAGEATRVGKLLAWVRDAAEHRAPVLLLADRLGGYFVLAVLVLAAVAAGLWLYMSPSQVVPRVVALLVITCPCALGMATPLAMAVAAGRAARAGIYVKSDGAMQLLASADTIVLDKTGTLTEGKLSLVRSQGSARAVELAAALEAHSNHPIAGALARTMSALTALEVRDVEQVAGEGIRGRVAGRMVAVGRPGWVSGCVRGASEAFEGALKAYAADGLTPVGVAVDGRWEAALGFGDPLRKDAAGVLGKWQAEGKRVFILSGDHPDVVSQVAGKLAVPPACAFGGIDPEGKRAFIEELRYEGAGAVVMVGDGVNDASALQAADVGIAIQDGTTASMVASDVFLTRSGVQGLSNLFVGAGHVMRVVRRNLGVSLVYNVLGATAAILGLVSPLVAAVAMPISSVLVVTSSIAQRSFVPTPGAASKPPAGLDTAPVSEVPSYAELPLRAQAIN